MTEVKYVPVTTDSIRIGHALAYPIYDSEGNTLIPRGSSVESRSELTRLLAGKKPHVHAVDAGAHDRAYRAMLKHLIESDATLGSIRDTYLTDEEEEVSQDLTLEDLPSWLDLQDRSNGVLRDCRPPLFLPQLMPLADRLRDYSVLNPDGALLALFYLSSSEIRLYSATHAMLVSVICGITARSVLKWPEAEERALRMAALTMNVGMTALQDELARQPQAPTEEQKRQIEAHPNVSADMLAHAGVTDENWLQAVRLHHATKSGPLAPRPLPERMARVIQLADIYSARRSPRTMRAPSTVVAAMQSIFFDENKKQDEAGMAIIKAVGVHPPGSFVTLANGETAIVVQRGTNSATPKAVSLVGRDGIGLAATSIRDTSQSNYKITGSVNAQDVKVRLDMKMLLSVAGA